MRLKIPELSLVVLIGASGSGKSSFARKHFLPTEVLSSDFCRALVSDDENDQAATKDAFEILHFIAAKRLAAGKLTVIDATNVQTEARKPLVELARSFHCLPVAIVLDLPEKLCQERNRERPDRDFGPHVIRQQSRQLRRSIRGLAREGFRHIHVLSTPEEVDAAEIVRDPLHNNKRHEHGPFDIIGDVHGCYDELVELLTTLGYEVGGGHPEGRKAVFLGDIVDRGPKIPDVLRLIMGMVESGNAFCAPGNHDMKLMRKLKGRDVQVTHGLGDSIAQLDGESAEFRETVCEFLDGLVSHYVLDDGKLVVAHAGMREEMQGRGSGRVRDFALYGETTGETDEFGLPVRYNWAAEYRGKAMVVYGHTPVPEPEWLNRTINIDTGCVFGGRLTALRYPEKEIVSVSARHTYAEPARPFLQEEDQAPGLSAQQQHDVPPRHGGRARQAYHIDPPAPQRDYPRGERHRGARGHEPICRQPEVADLPSADDVSVRDEQRAGDAGASGGGVRLLPASGNLARRMRAETHGLAGGGRHLPRRRCRPQAVRCRRRGCRDLLHPHGKALLLRCGDGDRVSGEDSGGDDGIRLLGELRD